MVTQLASQGVGQWSPAVGISIDCVLVSMPFFLSTFATDASSNTSTTITHSSKSLVLIPPILMPPLPTSPFRKRLRQGRLLGILVLFLLLVILFALTLCGCMSSALVVRDLFLVEFGIVNSIVTLRVGYYGSTHLHHGQFAP